MSARDWADEQAKGLVRTIGSAQGCYLRDEAEHMARALRAAYEKGRRAGLEEAADAAYKACPEMMNGFELRDAIRALLGKERGE